MHLHPHRARVARPALVTVWAGSASDDDYDVAETDIVANAEAALAGWLQADGFVGQYEHGTNRSLTIEFQVANEDEYGWISHNLELALPDVHRHVREVTREDSAVSCRRIRLYGEALHDFVDKWNLLARGTEIRVPKRLWTASHDEIAAYLRSIFQADGYVTVQRQNGNENGRVSFAVIGERWAEDVQLLLNVVGIYSRRLRKREARPNRHDLHELQIAIGSERARFAELVGFVGEEKQHKLLASLDLRDLKRCPDRREEEIVSIDELGIQDVYDIQTESGEYLSNNVAVHNCFILSIDDSMDSILDWIRREGVIFRGGSGSGVNLSKLRSSKEQLSKGGYASGPVSFMRGADASAGTIKSGGKTRRAAKMVVLDVDHPDVEEFIWCKAKEEEKARVLEAAGYDMTLDSPDWASIQYQNANNSVRVSRRLHGGGRERRRVEPDSPHRRHRRRDGRRARPAQADRRGGLEVRRPGRAVRHDDQLLAHAPEHGPDQRVEPVLGVHVDRRLRLQPRLAEPDEVPPRGRRARRRGVRARGRRRLPRPGDPRRLLVLSDARDRAEREGLPPARPRLREPRRAADVARPAVRLGRGPGVRGGDHRADDRPRLPQVGRDREADGRLRGLSAERGGDDRRDREAPRGGRQHRELLVGARRPARRGAGRRGTTRSTSARSPATATRRRPCWRRPGRSAS